MTKVDKMESLDLQWLVDNAERLSVDQWLRFFRHIAKAYQNVCDEGEKDDPIIIHAEWFCGNLKAAMFVASLHTDKKNE
jgi:hypothetical protein